MRRRRFLGLLAFLLALVASTVVTSPARAAETRMELGGAFNGYGTYMRSTPKLALDMPDAPRAVHGTLPTTGGLAMAGASGELTLAVDRHLFFPIAGLGISAAVGSSPRVLSSVDGSIVEQRAWTSFMGDILLPGFGFRFKERRWMFSGALRTGVSIFGRSGSLATGADTSPIGATGASLLLRAELDGCRRIDPLNRVCLTVSPSIYQFGFGNAVTVGIRWELGP